MQDSFGRTIEYMRISVTDRCNLRCKYCMPEDISLLSMDKMLNYQDIALIARAAVGLGITKFRITGGEPLLRRDIKDLVKMLRGIEGVSEVSLTTNGVLLSDYIGELKHAGIDGINVSLDTMNPDLYAKITGSYELEKVLQGINASFEYGIKTKINSVILKDLTMDNYIELAELSRDKKIDVRFIEMMPIGAGINYESIDGTKIVDTLKKKYFDMEIDGLCHGSGPAVYYKIKGFKGAVGVINSVHGRFCDSCNRIRLTSTGELKPCLCYPDTFSVMDILKTGNHSDREGIIKQLQEIMTQAVMNKPCGHDFGESVVHESKGMSQIGG